MTSLGSSLGTLGGKWLGGAGRASPRLLKIQIQTLGGAAFEASQLRGFLWGCREDPRIDVEI